MAKSRFREGGRTRYGGWDIIAKWFGLHLKYYVLESHFGYTDTNFGKGFTFQEARNFIDKTNQGIKPNPYSKTEIRTKPQFIWYRAYSADRKPEITQLFYTDKDKAIGYLKTLKFHGYGQLMIQEAYARGGKLAYNRPVRYTGWDNWHFVHGSKDNQWYLVGPTDRDYAQGFTTEQMRKLGPEAAKAQYLSPRLMKSNPGAMTAEQAMAEYRKHKEDLRKKLTEQRIVFTGQNISGELLHDLVVTEAPVFIKGNKYSVHQMSYGDYFLEPWGAKVSESEGFARGTIWLRKLPNKNFYFIGDDIFMNRRNPGKGSFNVEIYDATDIIRGHAVEIIPGYKQFYLYDQSLFRNVAKAMSYYALEKFAADNGMTLIMPDYTSPVKRNPGRKFPWGWLAVGAVTVTVTGLAYYIKTRRPAIAPPI